MNVNVVAINLNIDGSWGEAFGEPYQLNGPGTATIKASNHASDNAVEARITLQAVTGPTVNGVQRGRKFMELGLSQQAQVAAQHGDYNHHTPPKRARCVVEDGQVHWDALSDASLPFACDEDGYHLDITRDDQVVDFYQFHFEDNPKVPATKHFVYPLYGGTQVDYFSVIMWFWDYLIVGSKDPRVVAGDDHWTERAEFGWTFNGSGPIDAAGAWHKEGATGVFVDHEKFNDIIDGTRLPGAATNLYEAWRTAWQWYWEDQ